MERARWDRLQRLFEAVQGLSEADRAAYLARECADDAALRDEVQTLVRAGGQVDETIQNVISQAARAITDPPATGGLGRQIGPYKLIRELGRGGMGRVYLAERADHAFRLEVAIKIVSAELSTPDTIRRFRSERQILADFDHPNIARLLDGGTTEWGEPYLVMEYARGEPIDVYCDNNRLTVEQRVELFRRVCDAVDYAHVNGVVHRDIKPSNVLVGPSGVPKLLDFGIAKLLDPSKMPHTLARTRTGMLLLTPDYASPEQATGDPITEATDVHGLGALLYRLLVGRPPYQFDALQPETMADILSRPPGLPSRVVASDFGRRRGRGKTVVSVPAVRNAEERGTTPVALSHSLASGLDAITMKALETEPARRYSSVAVLSEDLRRWLAGLPLSVQSAGAVRPQSLDRRTIVTLIVAAVLTLVAVIYLVAR